MKTTFFLSSLLCLRFTGFLAVQTKTDSITTNSVVNHVQIIIATDDSSLKQILSEKFSASLSEDIVRFTITNPAADFSTVSYLGGKLLENKTKLVKS